MNSSNAIEDVCKTRIHPIDIFVGSRVRLRREELQITQQKLGSLLGLTFQQIQKYESGMNRVSASRLFEISRILLVDIKYFFEEVTEEILQVSVLSTAAEKCARWRRKSVPVGLIKKGLEALLIDARCEPRGA